MKSLQLNWGWGITIVYTVFAALTLSFVVFAMTKNVNLVEEDYYEQSLRHDATMIARSNATELGERAGVSAEDGTVTITIPETQAHRVQGSVYLYKASEVDDDKRFALRVNDSGVMIINTHDLQRGPWKVTVRWLYDGKEYEMQKQILIG